MISASRQILSPWKYPPPAQPNKTIFVWFPWLYWTQIFMGTVNIYVVTNMQSFSTFILNRYVREFILFYYNRSFISNYIKHIWMCNTPSNWPSLEHYWTIPILQSISIYSQCYCNISGPPWWPHCCIKFFYLWKWHNLFKVWQFAFLN